jgi:hypothetical protein
MDLTFWNQEWPLLRLAPHLAIGGAIAIALAVWALVGWSYRRKIARLKAENGAWESMDDDLRTSIGSIRAGTHKPDRPQWRGA